MTPIHDLTGAVSGGCLAPCAYRAAGRWDRAGGGCPHPGLPSVDRGRVREVRAATVRGEERAAWAVLCGRGGALACEVYPWWDHLDDADSCWVTARTARRILGVNHTRLNQLVVRGFILFEMHVDGTRLYRRAELRVVAHARDVRWARYRRRLASWVRLS
jgi:hypothetical protein